MEEVSCQSWLVKTTRGVFVFLASFVLAFTVASLGRIGMLEDTSANSSQMGVNIEPILSLNTDTQYLLLQSNATNQGQTIANNLNVYAATNNPTGYTLTMSTATEDTDLVHTNGTSRIASTENLTATTLDANSWGYNTGVETTNFKILPKPSSPTVISVTETTGAEDQTLSFGAKINMSVASGVYTSELVFSLVANFVPEPVYPEENWTGGDIYVEGIDFTTGTVVSVDGTACQSTKYISETLVRCTLPSKSNGTTNDVTVSVGTATHPGVTYDGTNKGNMQEFRTEQCAKMNRGQVQVWTDSRNSQTYRVKKMQDGKCWMIDNLRYADASWPQPDSGKFMTIDGTNTQSAENSPWTGYKNPGTATVAGCSAGSDLSTCYGYLYNWHTATYGTGLYTVASGDVAGNICPNSSSTGSTTATNGGWRLPKAINTATSDIGILNAGMAGDDGSTTNWTANNTNENTDVNFKNNWYPTGPYQGAYSGYYGSSLNSQGGFGYYWSSTASSATNARALNYYSSNVSPAYNYRNKYSGFAVRCLVE